MILDSEAPALVARVGAVAPEASPADPSHARCARCGGSRCPPSGRLAFCSVAESEELLTVAEIAATLKLNQQTVRNWIKGGIRPLIHYLDFWVMRTGFVCVAGAPGRMVY